MCSTEELEEMIETFKQLPELYQRGILAAVRDKKNLYDLQVSIHQRMTPSPHVSNIIAALKQPNRLL